MSQHHRLSQGGTLTAASQTMQSSSDHVLQSIMKKEAQYCEGIKLNHTLLKNMTMRLCDVQSLLSLNPNDGAASQSSEDPSKNEVYQKAITEQKQVIRDIAKENVYREQYVRTFCDTLQSVRNMPPAGSSSQPSQDGGLSIDYETAILQGVDALARKRHIDQEALIQQEQYYREIADALGDPKPTNSKNKQRRSGGPRNSRFNDGEEDDDDDDIEMTAPNGGVSQGNLKCPLTFAFMIDAVQNSVCHHIYSREGIMAHIEQGKRGYQRAVACPVAGCVNRQIDVSQLQEHVETSVNAKREIRRQDMRKEQQQMTANDLVDSDEE